MRFLIETVLTVALVALVLLTVLLLAGCAAAPPGESSDSLLSRLQDRQDSYCATADPAKRAVLLALLRTQVPTYPESGLCTDAEQVVFKELARQVADLPPVDVDQAVQDQELARERLNND